MHLFYDEESLIRKRNFIASLIKIECAIRSRQKKKKKKHSGIFHLIKIYILYLFSLTSYN